MNVEEFEALVVEAGELIGDNRFDEAVAVSKKALEFEDCKTEPFERVWPLGSIVAAYVFKFRENEPPPGSPEYEDLKKHLKMTLDTYNQLDDEGKKGFRDSNHLFDILPPLNDLMKENRPLSELQTTPKKKKGCFLATAVYGSYDNENVLVLRKFRDDTLMRTVLGRRLVDLYYLISPEVAGWVGKHSAVAAFARRILIQPLVDHLRGRQGP